MAVPCKQKRLRILPVALVLLAACGAEAPEADDRWPAVAGAALHVDPVSGSDGGPGTAARPFRTILHALTAPWSGTAPRRILLAPGTYAEAVTAMTAVELVGKGASAVHIEPPDGKMGISAAGKGTLRLHGLTVTHATAVGVSVTGLDVELQDVTISETKAISAGDAAKGGHGLQVVGADSVLATGLRSERNYGAGVLVVGARHCSIVDPSFLLDPTLQARAAATSAAIVDPSFLVASQTVIAGNWGGGIAIVDPSFLPKPGETAIVDPSFDVAGAVIRANRRFGIALFGASARVRATAVLDTGAVLDASADGVVVAGAGATAAGAPQVTLDAASVVAGNLRAGVLVAADNGPALRVRIDGAIAANLLGGAWAQGSSATLEIASGAHVFDNRTVGVAATMGAALDMGAATIERTKGANWREAPPLSALIGDGAAVLSGAKASLQGTVLRQHARAGVLLDAPALGAQGEALVTAKGARIEGCAVGIAANGPTSGIAGLLAPGALTIEETTEAQSAAAGFSVVESPCGAAASAMACVPFHPATTITAP